MTSSLALAIRYREEGASLNGGIYILAFVLHGLDDLQSHKYPYRPTSPTYKSTFYNKTTPPTSAIMNALRSAGNYISNKTQGGAHAASKETNKQYVLFWPNVTTD
jgi:hypothetical protein